MDRSAYLSQLIGLLPPGDALAREPGSVLERLLSVPAAELARVDGRVDALLTESDPARTVEMLADWERALGLPDICYPNFQFSRASRAWYFDGAGVLREAAVDEPRYLYDTLGRITDAVVVEAAATNFVANARLGGAAVGTPGTLPTGFTVAGAPLALAEVTFAGLEDGLPCVELRIAGTLGAATDLDIAFTTTTATPAVVADVFAGSFFWRLITGTAPTNWRMRFEEYSSGGALLVGNQVDLLAATNAALRGQRVSSAYTVGNASAAFLRHVARLRFAAGAVNTTLRLAVPQLERGAVATSPILNPVGAPAATTRAADQLYIATTQERRQRILARLIERFEPTPAAIIGLAAKLGDTVTLTEFRPFNCENTCEAPVLDDAWAHAFQVAGGAQLVVEFTCEDGCETPLGQWRTGAYECAIRRFAPAQTVPIFSYGGGAGGGTSIYTENLALHFDFSNTASYPGSGPTITDLTGNGRNGTLNGGVSFSSGIGGHLQFDGVDDFISLAYIQPSMTANSIEMWFSSSSVAGNSLLFENRGSGAGRSHILGLNTFDIGGATGALFTGHNSNDQAQLIRSIGTGFNSGGWYQVVAVFSQASGQPVTTESFSIFVNGALIATNTSILQAHSTNSPLGPGNGNARLFSSVIFNSFLSGGLGITRIYHEALSGAKIAQNFNANRARFGL